MFLGLSLKKYQVEKYVRYANQEWPYNMWNFIIGHSVRIAFYHYSDVIISAMESQITSITIVYSTVYSGADQRKHQSSASLAFVRGIHRSPVNSPHKVPGTRKMFPFGDVIMIGTFSHISTEQGVPLFELEVSSCWCQKGVHVIANAHDISIKPKSTEIKLF